jgi:hypothetical protein
MLVGFGSSSFDVININQSARLVYFVENTMRTNTPAPRVFFSLHFLKIARVWINSNLFYGGEYSFSVFLENSSQLLLCRVIYDDFPVHISVEQALCIALWIDFFCRVQELVSQLLWDEMYFEILPSSANSKTLGTLPEELLRDFFLQLLLILER